MKRLSQILPMIFCLLLVGCSSDSGEENNQGTTPDNPTQKEYSYQCNITWDGYTPTATFSDTKDSSKTSDEIATLFVQKHSRKVLSYPASGQKGVREHKVEYVLKEDANVKFSSSTENEEFDLENVDINDEKVLNYLRAETLEEQFQALMATKGESHDLNHFTLNVPLYGDEQTSIVLASNAEFTTNVTKYSTETNSYTFEFLLPGNTYYWKALGRSSNIEFDGGLFKVNDDNIRFANYSRVGNMRDLGGWKTSDNSRIKYNMLFRGRNVDSLNPAEKEAITETFGFKTQIDFRCDANGPINVRICPDVNYYYMNTSSQYDQVIKRDLNEKAGVCITPDEDNGRRLPYKEIIAKFFNLLSKEENYPVYFHCIHGADRTGTYAFLVEALLGVSLDDAVKDYELTSFSSKSGQRLRGKANSEGTNFALPLEDSTSSGFQHMLAVINEESGDTLKEKVENFLLSDKVGVSAETIQNVRNILVEQE